MILILAAGFAMACAAMRGPSAQRRISETLTMQAFVSGRTAAAINYVEAHELPGDPLWRALGGVWRWRLFNSGGPQVWAGRGNWLYFTDEMRPWPHAAGNMRFRADVLQRVDAALRAKHIGLLVALVPDKARIRAEGPRSAQAIARYAAFSALLRERGVPMVDLDRVFTADHADGPLFYCTDTHWNQRGAALAARAIAAAEQTEIDHSHRFETRAEAVPSDGEGDLLRLMSLDAVPDGLMIPLRPPIDREYVEHTSEIDPQVPATGLLGAAPPVDVTLLGTSFSRRSNFLGRLEEALHTVVHNFAETNGGFPSAARAYFSGPSYRDEPPKLIIWELPERFVGQPLTDDDRALAAMFSAPVEGNESAKFSMRVR